MRIRQKKYIYNKKKLSNLKIMLTKPLQKLENYV